MKLEAVISAYFIFWFLKLVQLNFRVRGVLLGFFTSDKAFLQLFLFNKLHNKSSEMDEKKRRQKELEEKRKKLQNYKDQNKVSLLVLVLITAASRYQSDVFASPAILSFVFGPTIIPVNAVINI